MAGSQLSFCFSKGHIAQASVTQWQPDDLVSSESALRKYQGRQPAVCQSEPELT
jgi:hypothetical protein